MTLAFDSFQSMSPEIQRRKFTLEEFERMSDLGLISEQHAELLNGEIFVKGMQSGRHAYAITTLANKMNALFQTRASVASQVPLILLAPPDFVEPDVLVRNAPASSYATRKYKVGQAVAALEFPDLPLEWW